MPTHCHLGASSCGLSPCTAPFPPGTRVCLARLGPFGKLLLQMRRFCRDKMPKAGGQGALGSGRRPGSDVACGSGAEVLVPREAFPSWPSVWGASVPHALGPTPPILRLSGGSRYASCGAPAPPGVGAARSGPSHYLPEGPLWLGPVPTPGPNRPPRGSQAPPPAAHTETTWRECNRYGSGETGETGVRAAGPAARRMDGWDVTATPPRKARAAGPRERPRS